MRLDYFMNYDTITGLPQMESFLSFAQNYMQRENFNRFAFLALHIQTFSNTMSQKNISDQYALLSLVHKLVRKQDYILSAYRHDSQVLVCLLDTSLLTDYSLEQSLFYAKELFALELKSMQPQISFTLKGGICFHRDCDSITLSIQHALSALQIARDTTSHTDFCIYEPKQSSDFSLETDILPLFDNSSISKRHTLIYLQPRFFANTMQPASAQALVRIIDNRGKLFSASSFLPVLEKNGLLLDLDLTVMERILQLITHWQNTGITPYSISIHLSDITLQNDSFYHIFEQLIEKYPSAFSHLAIEISSFIFKKEKACILSFMQALHQADGKLYVELSDMHADFSFENLSMVDGITCNRSFLLHTFYSKNNHSITRDFIESFENCKVSTICKSIETDEEADFARFCHFSDLQGFLYGRPLPIDIFQKKYMDFVLTPFL